MGECIILIGLQGAGKTTLYRQRFAASHAHVSMDLFPNARRKSARLVRELTRALDAGQSVVVDNTNPTIGVRAPLIGAARGAGAAVIGYYVQATPLEAMARNARRDGWARVPAVAIFATAKRLQAPLRAEGFDQLYRARMDEEGSFLIAEWTDQPGVGSWRTPTLTPTLSLGEGEGARYPRPGGGEGQGEGARMMRRAPRT